MTLKKIASIFALSLMTMSTASAANFSFAGDFTYDNDVQLFNFTVGATSTVELRSWSYAGGVNAQGQTIARDGFDPILALFNSSGVKIGQQDDAGCPRVAADSETGSCWDTRYSLTLAAGTYTASVQQYSNFARATLAQGFEKDGVDFRNFRGGFKDVNGNQRTNLWAFDILNVSDADLPHDVPEPASLGLLGLGLLGLAAARRRKSA